VEHTSRLASGHRRTLEGSAREWLSVAVQAGGCVCVAPALGTLHNQVVLDASKGRTSQAITDAHDFLDKRIHVVNELGLLLVRERGTKKPPDIQVLDRIMDDRIGEGRRVRKLFLQAAFDVVPEPAKDGVELSRVFAYTFLKQWSAKKLEFGILTYDLVS